MSKVFTYIDYDGTSRFEFSLQREAGGEKP